MHKNNQSKTLKIKWYWLYFKEVPLNRYFTEHLEYYTKVCFKLVKKFDQDDFNHNYHIVDRRFVITVALVGRKFDEITFYMITWIYETIKPNLNCNQKVLFFKEVLVFSGFSQTDCCWAGMSNTIHLDKS